MSTGQARTLRGTYMHMHIQAFRGHTSSWVLPPTYETRSSNPLWPAGNLCCIRGGGMLNTYCIKLQPSAIQYAQI